MTPEYENEKKHLIERYLSRDTKDQGGRTEVLCMTPLCSLAVARTAPIGVLPQHGLLGFHAGCEEDISEDEPILFTVNAPNSTFICGSQGSGKSYTLSAIFDDCLRKDESVNELTDPLAAVVFHYHNDSPTVAEAAYICSLGIKVGVLVSRSSAVTELKQRYLDVPGATNNDFTVNDFVLQDRHLTVKRMLKMMTFDESEWTVSLYMKVIRRTFRETAIKGQEAMMNMPLDLLKSFMSQIGEQGIGLFKTTPACDVLTLLNQDVGTTSRIIDHVDDDWRSNRSLRLPKAQSEFTVKP